MSPSQPPRAKSESAPTPARFSNAQPRPRAGVRTLHRALACGVALTLTPKCALCVVAYFGLAAGLGGVELCGETTALGRDWPAALALAGVLGGAATLLLLRLRRLPSSP